MDPCLECRAHEVTLSTHNREVFWLQHSRCAGKHCHGEWVAQPRATEVSSCAFSHEFLHESTIIHSSGTYGTICHDDSLVIISKDHLLDLWLSSSKVFFSRVELPSSPLVGLWFQLRLKQWGTHRAEIFLFFKIFSQNKEYWRWWNSRGSRKFLTYCTSIFFRSICHKFNTSL